MALGFNQQLLPAGGVPVHENDWPVDGIITPDSVLEHHKVSDLKRPIEQISYYPTRLRASLCKALRGQGTLSPCQDVACVVILTLCTVWIFNLQYTGTFLTDRASLSGRALGLPGPNGLTNKLLSDTNSYIARELH